MEIVTLEVQSAISCHCAVWLSMPPLSMALQTRSLLLASPTLALFPSTRISFVLSLAGKAGSAGVWSLVTFCHGVMEGCSEEVKPVAALETSRLKILFVFPQDFPGSLKHPGRLLRAMRNSRHLVVPRVQDRAVSTNSPEVRRQASRRSVRCV